MAEEKGMTELDRIAEEITALLKEEFGCYRENSRSGVLPSCDRQFEGVTDDGNNTFFRFLSNLFCLYPTADLQANIQVLHVSEPAHY